MTPKVTIFTDGACRGNPGPGGWGAILIAGAHEKELCGGEPDTTNNRMELMAAIMALETLNKPCRVELHTDSKYVQTGIQDWITASPTRPDGRTPSSKNCRRARATRCAGVVPKSCRGAVSAARRRAWVIVGLPLAAARRTARMCSAMEQGPTGEIPKMMRWAARRMLRDTKETPR